MRSTVDNHEVVECSYAKEIPVPEPTAIPAPVAMAEPVAPVPDRVAPTIILKSLIVSVVELIVVVVPDTVRSPPTMRLLVFTVPVKVGEAENTSEPVPVSPVTAAARFALVGSPRNAATRLPRPEIPVETGRPVQLVRIPEAGVPNDTPLNVLLLRVSDSASVANVEFKVGN